MPEMQSSEHGTLVILRYILWFYPVNIPVYLTYPFSARHTFAGHKKHKLNHTLAC
jgi:hypothetical protein